MRNFFSLPNTQTLHPEVVTHFKRNFFVNLMDTCFWFFGDSFAASFTILPVFMSTLTDSPVLIGLIPALEGAGWFIPQLFLAKPLERRNRRLPLVLALGIFDRLPFLLLAIGAFYINKVTNEVAIALFLVIYAVKVFSSGLVALPWQELIATVIPVSHRGRYWGSALTAGKLMGMVGAAISGYLLSNIAYPQNYGYSFLLGFCAVSVSYFFLTLNREPEIDRSQKSESTDHRIWGKMKLILSADTNFRSFLINRAFIFLGFMSLGFITVYGIQKFDLPISYSATFTLVMFISEILGYGFWGTLGDKYGYKRVIELSNVILASGLFAILLVDSLWGLFLVFGIISIAHSGEFIADQNIAMEFGGEADRPTYIGMSKTLTGPFILAAPIIGGGLVESFGYQALFLVSLIIAVIAFVIIKGFVKEPRLENGNGQL